MKVHQNPIQPMGAEQGAGAGKAVQKQPAFRGLFEKYSRIYASEEIPSRLLLKEISEWRKLEAIGAQSRVQTAPTADVTGFLELVHPTDYLQWRVPSQGAVPPANNEAGWQQEKQRLAEEYDLENIGLREQMQLIGDLSVWGKVSPEDIEQARYTVAPAPDSILAHLVDEPEFGDVQGIPQTRPAGRLEQMIHNEQFCLRYVQERYGQHCGQVKELSASHQRILDTLKEIQTGRG